MSHRKKIRDFKTIYHSDLSPEMIKSVNTMAENAIRIKFTKEKYADSLIKGDVSFTKLSVYQSSEGLSPNHTFTDSTIDDMEGGIKNDRSIVEIMPSSLEDDNGFAVKLNDLLKNATDIKFKFKDQAKTTVISGKDINSLSSSTWGSNIDHNRIFCVSIPKLNFYCAKGAKYYFRLDGDYCDDLRNSFIYDTAVILPIEEMIDYCKQLSTQYLYCCAKNILYYDPENTIEAYEDVKNVGFGFQKRKRNGNINYEKQREYRILVNHDNCIDERVSIRYEKGFRKADKVPVEMMKEAQFVFTSWCVNGYYQLRFERIVR